MTREDAKRNLIHAIRWNDMPDKKALEIAIKSLEQELITKNDLGVLLEKTYADLCNSEGGEGWMKIDDKEYSTDVAYALEGISIFMEVLKQRLAENEAL